jgi:hypothetical protein|tara:strand:- start:2030 stop:2551 length:522 start_codon:yes stop_codon:yes gene_type:complete
MSKFNRLLDAKFTPPKTWTLDSSLVFDSDKLSEDDRAALKAVGATINRAGKITAKKGFKTDLASVPRIAWVVIAPFDVARAAVIHDALYSAIRQNRIKNGYPIGSDGKDETVESKQSAKQAKLVADKVFLEAMLEADVPTANWKAYPAYWSVRLFGRWSVIPREDDKQQPKSK